MGHSLEKNYHHNITRRQINHWLGGLGLAAGVGPTLGSGSGSALGASSDVPLREGRTGGGGVELYYIQAGDGPLMLFLPGLPETWLLYRSYLEEFGQDHLAVAANLRGNPPSEQPTAVEDYAMRHLLEDIHRLIDHFGRESCILVANNWGAYVAYVFASAYPERVERLVIMNSGHPALLLRDFQSNPEQIAASQYELFPETQEMPYRGLLLADPIDVPASIEAASSMPIPDLGEEFFRDVQRPPATTSLVIDVPTLVIWGMQDPDQRPGLLDGLEDYITDMTLIRIEDAGHYPMTTHEDKVMGAIRDFIST